MSDMQELLPLLKRLRMSGILDNLDDTVKNAMKEKWSYTQLLLQLFSGEAERRDQKQYHFRLSRSHLDHEKTIQTYDFNFNRSIPQSLIKELCQCNFIEKQENIFLVGPSGVGKTHLANAIGHEACRKGYQVLIDRTSELLEWLHSGKGDASFQRRKEAIIKVPLLILDDFGLIPLNGNQQIYLYDIISYRYEKYSTIITSNRDFDEWINVFDNPLIGSAAMDRLVHKAIKLVIEGESYRSFNFKNNQKKLMNKVAIKA